MTLHDIGFRNEEADAIGVTTVSQVEDAASAANLDCLMMRFRLWKLWETGMD